jgi:hypothetical protein
MIADLAMFNDPPEFGGDELDAEAISMDLDAFEWLRDNIVWPEPGYDNWLPTGPGWVREIESYTEFADTLNQKFALLFEGVTNCAELIESTPEDTNPDNNRDCVTISPPGTGELKTLEIPFNVRVRVDYPGANSYWDITLVTCPPGDWNYPVAQGNTLTGWCVDLDSTLENHHEYDAELWSSYDPGIPYDDEDWPQVNWIINHKADFPLATWEDFQEAIWYFIDHGSEPTSPQGIAIRDAAVAYHDVYGDFIPQEGQWIAVLVYIPGHQYIFMEVDP